MKLKNVVFKVFFSINILIAVFILPFSVRVLASSFVDNNQINFNNGTYSNTQWDTSFNEVGMTPAGRTAGTGTYTSSIKDAGGVTSWTNFTWTPPEPYNKELPDNNGSESYPSSSVNMAGNLGLWHLNESASNPTSFLDTSGNSNNIFCASACPSPLASAVFNAGRDVNSANQYFLLTNNLSVRNRSVVALSMWFRPQNFNQNRVLWSERIATGTNERLSLRINTNARISLSTRNGDSSGSAVRVQSTNSALANSWNHVLVVYNATTDVHKIYLNNTLTSNSNAVNPFPNTNPFTVPQFLQEGSTANTRFNGQVDEIAMFTVEPSAEMAQSLYQRGVTDIRFQIRSCDNPTCTGFNFIGPDGTTTSFYTDNIATSYPPLFPTTSVASNRYFQYQATLITTNSTYWPAFNSVSINYTAFTPNISFAIRNNTDTGNFSSCDLGTASASTFSSCSYRIKVTTNATNGYTVFVNTTGNLTNGTESITNANTGTGGAGGTLINGSTTGSEAYGVLVNPGSITGGSVSLNTIFNAGGSNSVLFNYSPATTLYTASGQNFPAGTDTTNTSLVSHNLNISGNTAPGIYTQTITYTVVPNF